MKRTIDREDYLRHARSFSDMEYQLVEQFSHWLPVSIIDCHAHCNLQEHFHGIDDSEYCRIFSTFPSFSIDESIEWHSLLYPGKIVRSLRFPVVLRGVDHRAANFYLLEQSPTRDRVAIYGLPDDHQYTIRMLEHPRVSALKMYYFYSKPPATEIYQYFPKTVLEVAQDMSVPIILHLPALLTLCLDQILKLINDFPRLMICIAHLGLVDRMVEEIVKAYSEIAKYPLVVLDTSMISSREVVSTSIEIFGTDRIMYGSDEPLNLIRAVAYKNPRLMERMRYITKYPYHWVNLVEHEEFKSLASGATHIHWQSLLAIKGAIDMLPEVIVERAKQEIFCENAKIFYGFT